LELEYENLQSDRSKAVKAIGSVVGVWVGNGVGISVADGCWVAVAVPIGIALGFDVAVGSGVAVGRTSFDVDSTFSQLETDSKTNIKMNILIEYLIIEPPQ
jgi:hypothetical protein